MTERQPTNRELREEIKSLSHELGEEVSMPRGKANLLELRDAMRARLAERTGEATAAADTGPPGDGGPGAGEEGAEEDSEALADASPESAPAAPPEAIDDPEAAQDAADLAGAADGDTQPLDEVKRELGLGTPDTEPPPAPRTDAGDDVMVVHKGTSLGPSMFHDEVVKEVRQASADAPAPASADAPAPEAPTGYVVAPGRSLTSKRGIRGPGQDFRASDVHGGEKRLRELAAAGFLIPAKQDQ